MNFSLQYSFDTETKQFIASIPEFNLSDYGDTLEEADKNVKAMLSLYIEESSKTIAHNHSYA